MTYTAYNSQDSSLHEAALTLEQAQEQVAEKGTHWSIMTDADFQRYVGTDFDGGEDVMWAVDNDGVTRITN